MAIMTLKRTVTQRDLEPVLELESFMEDFNKSACGPYSAKVTLRSGIIYIGGYPGGWMLPYDPDSTWYTLSQDGGHPV